MTPEKIKERDAYIRELISAQGEIKKSEVVRKTAKKFGQQPSYIWPIVTKICKEVNK